MEFRLPKINKKSLSAGLVESVIIWSLFILVLLFLFFAVRYALPSYSIEMVPYTMEEGDTIFNVIIKLNEDYKDPYYIQELVHIMQKENNLDGATVYAGKTYLVPKLK